MDGSSTARCTPRKSRIRAARRAATLLIASTTLILGGCDYFYGFYRTADGLTVMPQESCVVHALASVPKLERIEALPMSLGGRPITLRGVKAADKQFAYRYEVDGIRHGLVFVEDYKGAVRYSASLLRINQKPPEGMVETILPVLGPIEQAIESQCGVSDLSSKVHQRCIRIDCDAGARAD